jgi:hypothetical protein
MNFEKRTALNLNPPVSCSNLVYMNKLFSSNKTKFCCILLIFFIHAKAQRDDSLYYAFRSSLNYYRFKPKQLCFPVSCIVLGSFSNQNPVIINNRSIKEQRDENMPHFRTHVDDYLQYAPIVAGYSCLAMGSKQNGWLYTKEVLLNELIMTAGVSAVKRLSKVPSVVNGSYNAFPSGHTTQAFSVATLFSDNFARGKPWLQCLSYGSASVVGVLRILN